MGSSREESNTPSETVITTPTVVDALPVGIDSGPDVLPDSPLPEVYRPFSRSPVGTVADLPNYSTSRVGLIFVQFIYIIFLVTEIFVTAKMSNYDQNKTLENSTFIGCPKLHKK